MKYLILSFLSFIPSFATYDTTANANELGMYYQEYNSMMALTGILIGFSIMIGAILLTVKVGSGK